MTAPIKAELAYFATVSLTALVITAADKIKAVHGSYRIPESTLILIASLGGALAMFLTMLVIRHKTRRAKFMLGLPIIILFQAIAVTWITREFIQI